MKVKKKTEETIFVTYNAKELKEILTKALAQEKIIAEYTDAYIECDIKDSSIGTIADFTVKLQVKKVISE